MPADPASHYTRTELVWAGKRTQVDRIALPFQRVETVNAPRAADLFTAIDTYTNNTHNKLFWGDNKLVMASLLRGDPGVDIEPLAGKVDLIYIDPPFDTGADFTVRTQIGDEEIHKEPSILENLAYRDTWGRGVDSYLQMMHDRLVLMRDLLSSNGTICVHCDYRVNSLIRIVLDELFGRENMINEIVWHYRRWTGSARNFLNMHDTILIYGKGEDYKFNEQWVSYTEESAKRKKNFHTRIKGDDVFETSVDERGVKANDVWIISAMNSQALERTGYSTQKPEELLAQIIRTFSDPNDLVADFFVGSGTTAAVAHKLGRRWIGVDLGRFAIHTSRKRLLDLGATFDVLNLGKYERSHWQGVTLGDQLRAYLDFILSLYHAGPVPDFKHLHGVKAGRAVHVGAVDAPVTFDELDDVLAECRATSTRAVDVLGWEWEMGVNQQAQQRAETFGVDLRLYQIPNDVMDRRARAADVKFYSLAFVEAAIRHVQARTVQVELTDFIIPDLDLIPEAVRDKVKRWSDYIDYWAVDFEYARVSNPPLQEDTFRNGWQAFRTRARRTLDTTSATHTYETPGVHTIAIKVVDVFGIDSTKCLEVTV